jgi:pimeloyl-[acyl-carrier protein] methyl ester esterase
MKPTIILLSGWAHPARAMKPLADRFMGTHEVIMLSTMELNDYADGLVRLIRERSTPPYLLGWSMGSLIALQAVADPTTIIAGMILLAGTPRFCSAPDFAHGPPDRNVRALSIGLRKNALGTLSQFMQDTVHPARMSPQAVQTRVGQALEFGVEQLCKDLRFLQESDQRTTVAGIQVPTLILHGREDKIIPCQAGEWLREHMKNSRLRILDQMGHNLPFQRPDFVYDEAQKFFAEKLA